jgi:hypothetical protein
MVCRVSQRTRDLRRRLCHPEWARRIDDPVHEELQAIADHCLALAPERQDAEASISSP